MGGECRIADMAEAAPSSHTTDDHTTTFRTTGIADHISSRLTHTLDALAIPTLKTILYWCMFELKKMKKVGQRVFWK